MTNVTRFDTRATDEGEELRLFDGRKKVFACDVEDVAIEDWEDALQEYIDAGDATVDGANALLLGEEEDEGPAGDIVPRKYRERYGAAQNCGDEVAATLTAFVTLPRATKKDPDGGLDNAKLRAVAEANGIGDRLAEYEERGLNGGLRRMNVGNILRGMVRRGERVEIGDRVWEAAPTDDEVEAAENA